MKRTLFEEKNNKIYLENTFSHVSMICLLQPKQAFLHPATCMTICMFPSPCSSFFILLFLSSFHPRPSVESSCSSLSLCLDSGLFSRSSPIHGLPYPLPYHGSSPTYRLVPWTCYHGSSVAYRVVPWIGNVYRTSTYRNPSHPPRSGLMLPLGLLHWPAPLLAATVILPTVIVGAGLAVVCGTKSTVIRKIPYP